MFAFLKVKAQFICNTYFLTIPFTARVYTWHLVLVQNHIFPMSVKSRPASKSMH